MVTGASGLLGRAIVQALAQRDEVRATVRRPEAAEALRVLGAKVAVLPVEEPDELIEILPRVHTIVHLVGGVNQPSDEEILAANYGSTIAAVAAAKEGRVRRLILLSVPGASIDHPHPFLRAKGLAEEVVVNSGLEHAVLRSSHAYGLGGLWFASTVMGAEHGFVVGDGTQRLAPVFAEDVAKVVAAIDDRRDPIEGVWSIWRAGGAHGRRGVRDRGGGWRAGASRPGVGCGTAVGAPRDPGLDPRDGALRCGLGRGRARCRLGVRSLDDAVRGGSPRDRHEGSSRGNRGSLIRCAAMPELVHLEVDDGVGIVRLDRPPANAISLQLSIDLLDALEEAGARDDVGALVLWGGPKLFAAGADIKEMVDHGPDEIREQVTKLGDACELLEATPKISIAAITGFALGGGFELSLACDLRYAADDAKVGQPEVGIGVIPGAGGTQRMTWLAGAGVSRDLSYTGRQVDAEEAKALKLVERVLPAEGSSNRPWRTPGRSRRAPGVPSQPRRRPSTRR